MNNISSATTMTKDNMLVQRGFSCFPFHGLKIGSTGIPLVTVNNN